jgi:hypothetical protein
MLAFVALIAACAPPPDRRIGSGDPDWLKIARVVR